VGSFQDLDVPKTSPQSVASAIFDGMDQEEEDIFPDPMSAGIAEAWRTGAVKSSMFFSLTGRSRDDQTTQYGASP
jgi:hypothetical protein